MTTTTQTKATTMNDFVIVDLVDILIDEDQYTIITDDDLCDLGLDLIEDL